MIFMMLELHMEIVSKISKGSKMDQIYISKNRHGFPIGNYVKIVPLNISPEQIKKTNPYFYNIEAIEPIKLKIIENIFEIIDKKFDDYYNIIITGSFLDKGFCFNDVDMLILSKHLDNKPKNSLIELLENKIKSEIGVKPHIVLIDNKSLMKGLSTDPLYQSMLSKCISKKRLIYRINPINSKINYKLLDLHLLKSKTLLYSFDILSGNEKYYYTQNMIAINLFLKNKNITKDEIEKETEKIFGIDKDAIKQNLIDKKEFLREYKKIYNKTFNLILEKVKEQNGSKQKSVN